MMKDLTGTELTPAQEKLVEAYRLMCNVLMGHRDELAPYEERNTVKAVAAMWQVMNGLDLDPGQVYDLGA
jgi:hypothetical protein